MFGNGKSKGERLQKGRSQKQSLLAQGIQGWSLMEAMTTLSLERRESSPRSRNRCRSCWFDKDNCICHRIHEIASRKNNHTLSSSPSLLLDKNHIAIHVKVLVLMHPKEYLCAGNSAKLLRMLLLTETQQQQQQEQQHQHITVQYYIFGKLGDVDKLVQEMMFDMTNTMILWPDKDAPTVSTFLDQRRSQHHQSRQQSTGTCTKGENSSRSAIHVENEARRTPTTTIRAVLLDGTYTQARNMHKSLRKYLHPTPLPVMVQLHPMNSSVFHRAQKNYGHAHQHQQLLKLQQSSADEEHNQGIVIARRVSTAEACGQLLLELGASPQILENIVEAVIINNEALRRNFTNNPTGDDE